jgi:hypothetical protein
MDSAPAPIPFRPPDHVAIDASPIEAAMRHWGLTPDHILSTGERPGGVVLVTRGGQKLVWPDDRERILTESQKDGQIRGDRHLKTPWNEAMLKRREGAR